MIEVNSYYTLIAATMVLLLGKLMVSKIKFLRDFNIPEPVAGGLVAAIWAEKFDQIASFQNFLVVPLTFLSGVFYSVHSLPPFWQAASHANPFFYMVDGFRYAFFGQADIDPWLSLGIVATAWLLLALLAMRLLHRGYHLRY